MNFGNDSSVPPIMIIIGVVSAAVLMLVVAGVIVNGDDPAPEHRVLFEEYIPAGISLMVEIPHPYTEDQVRAVSTELRRADDRRRTDRLFVLYYLPGMEVGYIPWATGHYDPDLVVRIRGTDYEGYLAGRHVADDPGVVGVWIQVLGLPAGYLAIRETATGYVVDVQAPEAGPIERDPSEPGRFTEPGNVFGEFYVIDERGDLEVWGTDGLIMRYPRIQPWE